MNRMAGGAAAPVEYEQKRPWRTYVNSRRFAWFHLGCALFAGAVWYISDGRAGPWPLAVAAMPWLARLLSGRFPLPTTRLDFPLALFLVTAGIGAWASYTQTLAWNKLWLIIGGVVIFYALAGQRGKNLWPLFVGLSLFGAAVAAYFLLTHDWVAMPAKIEALNQAGLLIGSIRPRFFSTLHMLHPNVAGGIIAMMIPFAVASAARALSRQKSGAAFLAIISLVVMGIGLLLTTSRGAWLALLGGIVVWLLWTSSNQLAGRLYLTQRKTFALGLLLLLCLGLSLLLLYPGGLVGVLDRLPGPASAGSRVQLSQDALDVARDFWLLGAGLATFEGLYSQYILLIPFYSLIHSHNLFLNTLVEQGVLGLAALATVIVLCLWWLSDPERSSRRRSIRAFSLANGATMAVLVVMCLHGMVDDPLYGSRGVLLLFLPAGITAILFPKRGRQLKGALSAEMPALVAAGVAIMLAAGFLIAFRSTIVSAWHSNLGAIEMARVELVDYPSGKWREGLETAALLPAMTHFELALRHNPENLTALYRLGLISLQDRNFDDARKTLYNAYLLDREHRGIRKALAYSTLWSGDLDNALPHLLAIPEAAEELGSYQSWWAERGYPDQSRLAEAAQRLIEEQSTP